MTTWENKIRKNNEEIKQKKMIDKTNGFAK